MSNTSIIKIPGLKLVSPNVKKHWAQQHCRNKKTALVVRSLLNAQKHPSLPLSVLIVRIAPRMMDYDNLVASCKFLADCIGDCLIPGLAPGRADGTGQLHFTFAQRKGGVGEYAVEITIEHKHDHCGTCPACKLKQEESDQHLEQWKQDLHAIEEYNCPPPIRSYKAKLRITDQSDDQKEYGSEQRFFPDSVFFQAADFIQTNRKYYYDLYEIDMRYSRANYIGKVYSKQEAQDWVDSEPGLNRCWHEHFSLIKDVDITLPPPVT